MGPYQVLGGRFWIRDSLDRSISKTMEEVTDFLVTILSLNKDDVESWQNSVEEYALMHGWDDKTTSYLALGKPKSVAGMWYRGLPNR